MSALSDEEERPHRCVEDFCLEHCDSSWSENHYHSHGPRRRVPRTAHNFKNLWTSSPYGMTTHLQTSHIAWHGGKGAGTPQGEDSSDAGRRDIM